MKKIICHLILFAGLFGFSQNPNETVAVSAALEKVKEATIELATTGFFDGTFDVSVKFNDIVTDENSLELKIWFISFKKSRNKTIDNSYIAKYQFSTSKRSQSSSKRLVNDLAEVLKNGIQAYKDVDPQFMERNGFEVVSSFTIEKSFQPGVQVEIEPISIGASKKRLKKSIHTITLTFTPKAPKKSNDHKEILEKSNEILTKTTEVLEASKELLEKHEK